ncbi:hypothetical protein HK104_010695 [Borealophlyctis nickersoniae]|nr:hypothetical protein HK104_010695 [Borealophlyctis nickersoniae]
MDLARHTIDHTFTKEVGSQTSVDFKKVDGLGKSFLVGVAMFPPDPKRNEPHTTTTTLTVPPPTAVRTYLYQPENCDAITLLTDPSLPPDRGSPILDGLRTRDITFLVEGKELCVHLAVLKSKYAGPYFAAMFAHDMQESLERQVQVADVGFLALSCCLEYIYSGCTHVEHLRDLAEVYGAADKYQITPLALHAKNELHLALSNPIHQPEQLCSLLETIHGIPGLSDLMSPCVGAILQNWDRVKHTPEWKDILGLPGMVDVIMEGFAVQHRLKEGAGEDEKVGSVKPRMWRRIQSIMKRKSHDVCSA